MRLADMAPSSTAPVVLPWVDVTLPVLLAAPAGILGAAAGLVLSAVRFQDGMRVPAAVDGPRTAVATMVGALLAYGFALLAADLTLNTLHLPYLVGPRTFGLAPFVLAILLVAPATYLESGNRQELSQPWARWVGALTFCGLGLFFFCAPAASLTTSGLIRLTVEHLKGSPLWRPQPFGEE
jgi:hypothetical protein